MYQFNLSCKDVLFFGGSETLNPPTQHPATLPRGTSLSWGPTPRGSSGKPWKVDGFGYGGWKPLPEFSHPFFFGAVELPEK